MNSSSRSIKRDFVRHGWFALHEAVLAAGAEIDTGIFFDEAVLDPAFHELPEEEKKPVLERMEIFRSRFLDTEGYSALLQPIIKITGVVIQSPSDDAIKVGADIWTKCLLLKKQLSLGSNAFNKTSMNGFAGAYSEWKVKQKNKYPPISIANPLPAARIGWEMIQNCANHDRIDESLFWGLGILGWVTTIYSTLSVCKYCFRWSVAGSPFCYMHTQSLGASTGCKYVRYRKAKIIKELADKRNLQIRPSPSLFDGMYRSMVLAELLFFNVPNENDILWLRYSLEQSPRVLNLLGGASVLSLPDHELFNNVRQKINPMEYIPAALTVNIPMAENLLTLDEELSKPKANRRSERVSQLIEKAILMFNDRAKPTDVAAKLGVSRSTVSNWINRYPAVHAAYRKN